MKRIIFAILGTLFITTGFAQEISLLTFGGYTFSSSFDYSTGTGKVNDGFQWGGGLEFKMNETKAIELIYQRMDASGYVDDYSTVINNHREGTVGMNYIMLGGTNYIPMSDKVSGFGTIDVGAAVISPSSNSTMGTITKFAWGLRGGVKIAASEKVSLRLHAQLMSPVQSFGLGLYFGSGGGGAGGSTFSTIYQFNLGGSLNIRLK